MKRISGWNKWLLSDSWADMLQADAINQLGTDMQVQDAAHHTLQRRVNRLELENRAQGAELDRLRATLAVVLTMLDDRQLLDTDELDRRMSAIVGPEVSAQPVEHIICHRCAKSVSRLRTTITALGVFCDACAAST